MLKETLRLKNTKLKLWKKYLSASRTRYDREQWRRLASYAKKNPNVFWKYARFRLKTKQTRPTLIRKDGSTSSTAQEKAGTLNDFVASVFTEDVRWPYVTYVIIS